MATALIDNKYHELPADYPKMARDKFKFSADRVIVKLSTGADDNCGCCPCKSCGMPNGGIVVEERETVPPPLAAAGVTQAQYQGWIEDYLENVDPKAKMGWCEFFVYISVVGWLAIPFILCCCKVDQFNDAVLEWQDRINEGLKPPLFAKTQTILMEVQTGQYSRDVLHYPWLSVALTKEDADRLRQEPHNSYTTGEAECCGCQDDGCCGNSTDTRTAM